MRAAGRLVLLAATCLGSNRSAEAPTIWAGLAPGPYAVGYRTIADPKPVSLWYPAAAGGEPVSFGGYLGADREKTRSFLTGAGISSETVDALLLASGYATVSPAAAPGAFPLVMIAQGNGEDAADQAVLAEYLASQGMVVASTPSPMKTMELESEADVGRFAEAQADDLVAAAITAANVLGDVDSTRLAVVGHSFGARAALLVAMRQSAVRALVSLDGGIGTASGIDSLRSAPSFRADAGLPPILHLYEELDPFMKPDFTFLRSLHVEELAVEPTSDLHHVHFTTYGFAAAVFPEVASATGGDRRTGASVVRVAERVRGFLGEKLSSPRAGRPRGNEGALTLSGSGSSSRSGSRFRSLSCSP